MFEKTLSDIIRGIRNAGDEAKYVSGCLDDCRKELRSAEVDVKANAVAKLCYLQMLGYDISWAAFNIVEVMSSRKYSHKRIGYLAASQSFHSETDVLMLTTNLLKKDLASPNIYEAGLALDGLSNFTTPDLARDLANDIVSMMSSTKPYLRKKATLLTYKIFLNFPEALRPTFPRLKDKLDDDDPSVQAAAVSVICELARKNPKNYLSLAPKFFELLTQSQNNWLRIKIIKMFAALCPLEPRLAKKLVSPLTDLIHSTPAMSVLYECIMTVLTGIPEHTPSIQLCVQKLRIFIEDNDQNLKYLGLQALAKVLTISPKSVSPHRELILDCLEDPDESIRLRALDLLAGMATKKTLVDLIRRLVVHLDAADGQTYRDEVLSKVVHICSQSHYALITDFEWYIQVLVRLTRIEGTKKGKLLADQLLDVAIRVKSIRAFAVKEMAKLLVDSRLTSSMEENSASEVLFAAGYVVSEFAEHLEGYLPTVEALLHPKVVFLPANIQAIFVSSSLKLYGAAVSRANDNQGVTQEDLDQILQTMQEKLPSFVVSGHLEVQERAVMTQEIVSYLVKKRQQGENVDHELVQLFEGELNPVAARAQRKVPVPEGLDLDKWINTPPPSDDEEDFDSEDDVFGSKGMFVSAPGSERVSASASRHDSDDEDRRAQRRAARLAEIEANPFHLGFQEAAGMPTTDIGNIDDIPVKTLELEAGLTVDFPTSSVPTSKKKKKKDKKKRRKKGKRAAESDEDDDDDVAAPAVEIVADEEMPEGAHESDEDGEADDTGKRLDIDLDAPLDASETLPTLTHRETKNLSAEDIERMEKEKRREERRKRKEGDKKKKKKRSKDGESKDKKKKKKEKQEETSGSLLDLEGIDTAASSTDPVAADATPASADKPGEGGLDDLDFWLSDTKKEAEKGVGAASDESKPKKKKASKEKGSEASKGDKKKKKKSKSKKEDAEKAEEQESASPAATAEGDSEATSPMFSVTPLKPLSQDDVVAVVYDVAADMSSIMHRLTLTVAIANKTENAVSHVQLHPVKSSTITVELPPDQDHVDLPQDIAPHGHGTFTLYLQASPSADTATLRANMTYICGPSGETKQESIDLKIPVSPAAYVGVKTTSQEEFSDLLKEGGLQGPISIDTVPTDLPFPQAVATVASKLHLLTVEVLPDCASLYGSVLGGEHVCLLIKAKEGGFSVDAKGSNETFLQAFVNEITPLFA